VAVQSDIKQFYLKKEFEKVKKGFHDGLLLQSGDVF
jgi:hypothetical protein